MKVDRSDKKTVLNIWTHIAGKRTNFIVISQEKMQISSVDSWKKLWVLSIGRRKILQFLLIDSAKKIVYFASCTFLKKNH